MLRLNGVFYTFGALSHHLMFELAHLADGFGAGFAVADRHHAVHLTGDARAPGALVHAIYQGHRTARELGLAPAAIRVRRDAPFATADARAEEVAE